MLSKGLLMLHFFNFKKYQIFLDLTIDIS